MKKFITLITILSTLFVYAQDSGSETIEVVEQGEVTVEFEEAQDIQDAEIEPLTFDENDQMTSYAVKREGKNPLIIGIGERRVAIINAYAGAQLFFGVRAGIDLFDTVEFGVQANMTPGGNSDSPIRTGKSRKGFHANIKIHPFKNSTLNPTIYVGGTYTDITRKTIGFGYYQTLQVGKVVGGHIGFRIDPLENNSRHRIGIEIGYEKAINGLDMYEYRVEGNEPISTGNRYQMPTLNINYTIRLFK